MDINNLTIFLAVAEDMNFSKAAKRLFMSQQSVSSVIQKLEQETGTELFERKPVLRLTRAGEEMQLHAQKVMLAYKDMCKAVSNTQETCTATLRVGMSPTRLGAFFVPIWEKFHKMWPSVAIEVVEGNSAVLRKKLIEGSIHLFISVNMKSEPQITFEKCVHERILCGISYSLLKRYHPDITRADMLHMKKEGIPEELLQGIPAFSQNTEFSNVDNSVNRRAQFGDSPNLVSSSQQSLLFRLACTGQGYCLIYPMIYYINRELVNRPDGDVWVLPYPAIQQDTDMGIAYMSDWEIPDYAQDFMQVAREVMAEYGEFVKKYT